jgi:hypothetical protein
MWDFIQTNWHKILVVILALASIWKFFYQYVRPTVHHEKMPQPINIVLPKEGCVITVKPINNHSSEEDL